LVITEAAYSIISNARQDLTQRRRLVDEPSTDESSSMTTPFETLKREAVSLERQLEEKIGRYQQVRCNNLQNDLINWSHHRLLRLSNIKSWVRVFLYGHSRFQCIYCCSFLLFVLYESFTRQFKLTQQLSSNNGSVDYMSRVEQGLQDSELTTQQQDIQFLFNQLSDLINKRLKAVIVTPSQRATSQRYQEILQDLRADYEKSNQILRRARERQELMAGAAPSSNGSPNDAAMDSLLRERNHIQNSMNAAANVIGQAENIRQDLHWQGRTLRSTGSLMSQIAGNIPGINILVEQIRRRRSQDDRIVAGVIACCIIG
jgi:Snare region anchored in the vesicle membrane C-terminus